MNAADRELLEFAWQNAGDHQGCYRRVCETCGTVFFACRPEARFCGPPYRQLAYRQRRRRDGPIQTKTESV